MLLIRRSPSSKSQRISSAGTGTGLTNAYARSVMNLHMNRSTEQQAVGEIDIEKMKRYVTYCKS